MPFSIFDIGIRKQLNRNLGNFSILDNMKRSLFTSKPYKRGRWFQSDLSINSERCNLVAPAPHDLKSQWHTIIFHENASSEYKHFILNHFEQICWAASRFGTNVPFHEQICWAASRFGTNVPFHIIIPKIGVFRSYIALFDPKMGTITNRGISKLIGFLCLDAFSS